MTSIQKVNSTENNRPKHFLTPKNTGYTAAGAMLLTGVRAFSRKKSVVKSHKLLGYIASALTAVHIGLIEYYHHKYKKM